MKFVKTLRLCFLRFSDASGAFKFGLELRVD
jgi:hypothetical protein